MGTTVQTLIETQTQTARKYEDDEDDDFRSGPASAPSPLEIAPLEQQVEDPEAEEAEPEVEVAEVEVVEAPAVEVATPEAEATSQSQETSQSQTSRGSSKPSAKPSSPSAKNVSVQSRIRDLFWLEFQSQKQIKETLKKDLPGVSEENISKWVESTLRDEVALGVKDGNGNSYIFTKAGLFKLSGSGDKERTAKVTNFQCLSLTPIVRDDGAQQTKSLRLELDYKGQKATVELTPEDFSRMDWHFPLFDQRAVVTPKMEKYAVVGIQLAAPRKPKETIYTSTGWFVIDGQPYFLHNDGAIGANEHRRDLKAELKENLQLYSLPDPPTGEELKKAIRASLNLLDVGDLSVAVPLFASIWRAPLGDVNFMGWASGVTNSLKTSHAVVAQQFYGKNFDSKHLPATWSSTANFNLSRLHAAKDVLSVIDDLVLRGSNIDQSRQKAEADRFVRGVADGAFRGRLDAKHSDDAPSRGPRGLVWSTAETNPLGHSGQARLIAPTYRRKDDGTPISIDPAKLRVCQAEAESGLYSEAMAAYIQFLAQRYNDLFQNVQERVRELSAAISESANGQLLRTPEILASLAVGVEYFLYFAKSAGAIDEKAYQSIWEHCWKTLVSLGEIQTERLHEEDPVRETLRSLKSADRAGRLIFRKPDNPDLSSMGNLEGGPAVDVNQSRSGWFVGWRDDEDSDWWCDSEQLWKAVQALFREQNGEIPKMRAELFQEMANGGWITPSDEKGRVTVKREIEDKRVRVIEIPAESFDRLEQEGTSENASDGIRKEISVPPSPNFLGQSH